MGAAVTTPCFVDGKLIGGVNTFTFRQIELTLEHHELSASSNTGAFASLPIDAEDLQVVFVRLTGWPRMSLVAEEEGKKQVQKCKLLQHP